MNYNLAIHNRRSIRLPEYDYSQAGLYFLTICTAGRLCIFGDAVSVITLGNVAPGFKARTTRAINMSRDTSGDPVWQRNYYDHIIRSEDAFLEINQYIQKNPMCWKEDENYV